MSDETKTRKPRTRKKAAPSSSANWSADWLAAMGRNPWLSGTKPLPESLTAVHAAVRLLAAGILGANFRLIRKRTDGGVERISTGDLAGMLADLPVHELHPGIHDWLLGGNCYFRVIRNDRGGVSSIEWLERARCSVVRENGSTELVLKVSPRWSDAQREEYLAQGDYIHLKMLPSSSYIYGQSPLDRLSPGLSTAVAVVDGARAVIENSVAPGAILVTKQALLKPEARQRIREAMERMFSGQNRGKLAVLDTEVAIERLPTPEAMLSEAFVELAKFGVGEVARAFNVPLSLLAETTNTNRSTAEQESRAFATFSIAPLARELAAAFSRALIADADRRGGLRIDLDLSDALLGHGVERAEFASRLVNGGIASVNEVRDLLGLSDVTGGDELARPVNTQPQNQWLAGPQPAQPLPAPSEAQPAPEETQRMIRREAAQHDVADRAETRLKLIMCGQAADELAARRMAGSDIETLIRRST